MAKKDNSKKAETKPINQLGELNVGGNLSGNVIVGNNNVINIGGKQVEFHTGWFYGHRYGDLAAFTGRAAELKQLDDWLANNTDNLLLITAFGGFGKSALTWQWFNHRVDKTKWQTAVWWSFYEKESGFESFLAETLAHLGVEVKASARLQVNDLLEAMRGTNILIVLDGFERLLRQYGRMDAALQSDDEDADIDPSQRDCSSPLTETFLRGLSGAGTKSKVLMTTRLCPRVLESANGKLLKGCREAPLAAFSPEDAVTYLHNEGVKATRAETSALCYAYGYHPLSLSLLVGLINSDHEKRGDIEAVKNLEIFADVKARRHHVLERAYGSLAPERRDLLSKISCFRGSMEYVVLKKVFPSPDLDKALLDLRQRGLLQYVSPLLAGEGSGVRYDMHPIVRHYAYDRLTAADRKSVHERLHNYFLAILESKVGKSKTYENLEDIELVIELYFHTLRAGIYVFAHMLLQNVYTPLYYQYGAYQTIIELMEAMYPNFEKKALLVFRDLYSKLGMVSWTFSAMGNVYSVSGQPHRAVQIFEASIQLAEEHDMNEKLSIDLVNIANMAQIQIGVLHAAETNLQRSVELNQKLGIDSFETHIAIGRLLCFIGRWSEAENEITEALHYSNDTNNVQGMYMSRFEFVHRTLLLAREHLQSKSINSESAIRYGQDALELVKKWADTKYPKRRDFVKAYWLLGSAYRANNELTLAEENLSKALNLCRQINSVDAEADILLDIARLRYAQGDFKDAQEKASEALVITERCGYVLQGADVNLFLAQYALEQEKDKVKAKQYAEEAKKLATCDGPPYYYKVAYEEAEAMLEKLK